MFKREYHDTRQTVFTEGYADKTYDAAKMPVKKKNISQLMSSFQTVIYFLTLLVRNIWQIGYFKTAERKHKNNVCKGTWSQRHWSFRICWNQDCQKNVPSKRLAFENQILIK